MATATDRGSKLDRAQDSLERTREALAANLDNETAEDWRAAVVRAEARVDRRRTEGPRPGRMIPSDSHGADRGACNCPRGPLARPQRRLHAAGLSRRRDAREKHCD